MYLEMLYSVCNNDIDVGDMFDRSVNSKFQEKYGISKCLCYDRSYIKKLSRKSSRDCRRKKGWRNKNKNRKRKNRE